MKEIKSSFVKESLLDYENLANSLKESTSNAVRDLLAETVRETYNQILNESEDDYEVEDVDDTKSEEENLDAEVNTDSVEDEGKESDAEVVEDEESEEVVDEPSEEEVKDDAMESDDNDEWAEFEKYQVSDDEYDFSDADDEEIVKVYKLLKDTDEVLVNVDKDTNKVELKDNQAGTEYIIDLGSSDDDIEEDDLSSNNEYEFNDMNESIIFEVALNEYDSNVGYTDNYQKKDVMTTPSMKEPGKNVNDWDAGVPKSKSKPFGGKGSNAPFEKTVKEEESLDGVETVEEANLSVTKWNDTHAVHNRKPAASSDEFSRDGIQKTSKGAKYRAHGTSDVTESKMMEKVDKILKENKELKSALNKFKGVLQEAAVVNVNLGQIIKLISENSTTKAEKQEIIERFGSEAKTVEQSKQLYESISKELKKNNTMNISEEKQFTTNSSKMINETQIYKSKDLLDSLDLMHRLCK